MPPVRGPAPKTKAQSARTPYKGSYSLRCYQEWNLGDPFMALYTRNDIRSGYKRDFDDRPGDPRPARLKLADLTYLLTLAHAKDTTYLARVKRHYNYKFDFDFNIALKCKRRAQYRTEALNYLHEDPEEDLKYLTTDFLIRPEPPNRDAFIKAHFTNLNAEHIALVNMPWSPWVAGLVNTFYDTQNVYFGLEYIPRGTLRTLLNKHPEGLKVGAARFYYSNIVMALEFLESCMIVHRDLNPDNILIGDDGYLVLTDFGDALSASNKKADWKWKEGRASEYTAPECNPSRDDNPSSHPLAVDWWSSGVILYEMVTGRLPFIGPTPEETFARARKPVNWDGNFQTGSTLRDLVDALLFKDPMQRAGADVRMLQAHDWFSPVDWDKMALRRYLPPFPLKRTIEAEDRWMSLLPPNKHHTPDLNIPQVPIHLRYDDRFPYKQDE